MLHYTTCIVVSNFFVSNSNVRNLMYVVEIQYHVVIVSVSQIFVNIFSKYITHLTIRLITALIFLEALIDLDQVKL